MRGKLLVPRFDCLFGQIFLIFFAFCGTGLIALLILAEAFSIFLIQLTLGNNLDGLLQVCISLIALVDSFESFSEIIKHNLNF